MGSIWYISTNPMRWTAYETGTRLKEEYGGEELIKICYGSFDDDPGGSVDLEMLMRRSVYEKVMSGEYSVSPESKKRRKLILIDHSGKEVPPIAGTVY